MSSTELIELLDVELYILKVTLIILTIYHCCEFIKYVTKTKFSFSKSVLKIIEFLLLLISPRTQPLKQKMEIQEQQQNKSMLKVRVIKTNDVNEKKKDF